jgi:hypothetical protein
VLAVGWLGLVCAMVLVAVDLPLPARLIAGLAIAWPGLASIHSALLLRGNRAVRSLHWSAEGWSACVGPASIEKAVELAPGSFRTGLVLVLWLRDCDRTYVLCIDAGAQEARSFRSLCRRLRRVKPAS